MCRAKQAETVQAFSKTIFTDMVSVLTLNNVHGVFMTNFGMINERILDAQVVQIPVCRRAEAVLVESSCSYQMSKYAPKLLVRWPLSYTRPPNT